MNDHELARRLVLDASEWLHAGSTDERPDEDLGPRLTDHLREFLRMIRPGDGLLGEHVDDVARLRQRRVWLLDTPRDRRSQRRFRDLISLALSEDGTVVAGALALRGRGLVVGTTAAAHACETAEVGASVRSIGIDGGRRHRVARRLARATGAQLVLCPSTAEGAASVLFGEMDAHLQERDEDEWRSAAAVAVARTTGLHVSQLDGTRPVYNKARPVIPDLLICHPAAAGVLLAEIRDASP